MHSSPHNFRVIKSKRMKWTAHVTRTGERRGVYRALDIYICVCVYIYIYIYIYKTPWP